MWRPRPALSPGEKFSVARLLPLLLIMLGVALSGCAETQLASYTAKRLEGGGWASNGHGGYYKIGKPYQINGVWYYPAADPSYDQTGIASWYGAAFHGKMTADGEIFDPNALTAAHQTLPLPTYARVTDLENGRSIVVRINDRGPFVNGRIIDLSRRSAQLLGFEQQGTARVRVQAVSSGGVAPMPGAPVVPAPATQMVAQNAAPPAPRAPAAPATAPAAPAVPVDYQRQVVREVPVKPTGIYIQAGAFAQYDNARRLRAKLAPLGSVAVSSTQVNGVAFYRVRLGPLASVEQADQALQRLIAMGETGARIVVED